MLLAKILSTVVEKSERHLKNTEDFVNRIRDIQLNPDEILMSYDVSSLFTCIRVDSAIEAAKNVLQNDNSWNLRKKSDCGTSN